MSQARLGLMLGAADAALSLGRACQSAATVLSTQEDEALWDSLLGTFAQLCSKCEVRVNELGLHAALPELAARKDELAKRLPGQIHRGGDRGA